MRVIVSIVSYNTKDLLKKILKKIASKYPLEIWVVDNDSSDNSAEAVKRDFPKVKLIANSSNLGFGNAHNQILKKVKEGYVFIINPDIDFKNDLFDKMVDFMEINKDCGIASCKITYPDGTLQPNAGELPIGIALITWLFNLDLFNFIPAFHRTKENFYRGVHPVGWVGGTLMVIRAEVIKKIGLFNPDYFMYFEDVELCFRAKKAGFKVLINPEVSIKHIGGASSKNPRFNQWVGEFRGLLRFYQDNFGFLASLGVRVLVYISILLRIVTFTIINKGGTAKTYARVLFSI